MSIQIHEVSKSFQGNLILDRFSMVIPDTGIIGLSGPSGCGKTTLLKLLAGLVEAERGWITGLENKRISMVFQEDRLLPWLTVAGNVAVVQPEPTVVRFYLDSLQLTDKASQFPAQLSGGMQRRVALARALAYGGDVFLFDEPFKGMDLTLKESIYPCITDLKRTGGLVILVSHDEKELASLTDQIWHLDGPPLKVTIE